MAQRLHAKPNVSVYGTEKMGQRAANAVTRPRESRYSLRKHIKRLNAV
jgi:hypothetical protein